MSGSSNVIPPITDPSGTSWVQPIHDDILISDDSAVMSLAVFGVLREYSSTMPTGVYPGKMWKAEKTPGEWYLVWYGIVSGREDICSNNYRRITIMDWKAMTGLKERKP